MTNATDPDRNFFRAIYALVALGAVYFAAHFAAFVVRPPAPVPFRACVEMGYSMATCEDAIRTGRPLGTVLEEEGVTE